MFAKNKIHLIPPFLLDRANLMLTETSELVDIAARENCAQQLETIRDFCIGALGKYEKQKVQSKKKERV